MILIYGIFSKLFWLMISKIVLLICFELTIAVSALFKTHSFVVGYIGIGFAVFIILIDILWIIISLIMDLYECCCNNRPEEE